MCPVTECNVITYYELFCQKDRQTDRCRLSYNLPEGNTLIVMGSIYKKEYLNVQLCLDYVPYYGVLQNIHVIKKKQQKNT